MSDSIIRAAVLYYSRSGHTKTMAGAVCRGMERVEGVEVRSFSLDEADAERIRDCRCVVLGTPTYVSSVAAEVKAWLDGPARTMGLPGKIGGAFATADYVHGGADLAIRLILDHMMTYGMLTYSGGGSQGRPVIHLGPVAIAGQLEQYVDVFQTYGERMARKTVEIFG